MLSEIITKIDNKKPKKSQLDYFLFDILSRSGYFFYKNNPYRIMLIDFLDRPIAYHRIYRYITGSTVAALFLSQMVYWQRIVDKGNGGINGWIYKTIMEIEDETGLSRQEQITARNYLKRLKILNEKKEGLPRKLFYKVDLDALERLLVEYQIISVNSKNPKNEKNLEKQYTDAAIIAADPDDIAAYTASIQRRLDRQGGLTDADRKQLRQWEQATRPVPKIRSGDLIDFGTYRHKIKEIRGSCLIAENGKVLPIGPIIDDIRKGKLKLISFSR